MSSEYRGMRAELPARIVELVDAFRDPLKQIEFLYLLALLLLAAVAIGAQADPDPLEWVARMLWEAGWQRSDAGTPLTKWEAREAAADTHLALIRLGALAKDLHGLAPDQPTPDGATFARAALLTWPA